MSKSSTSELQWRALDLSIAALRIHIYNTFRELRGRNVSWVHTDVTTGGDRGVDGLVGVNVFIKGKIIVFGQHFNVTTETLFVDRTSETLSVHITLSDENKDTSHYSRQLYRCGHNSLPVLWQRAQA